MREVLRSNICLKLPSLTVERPKKYVPIRNTTLLRCILTLAPVINQTIKECCSHQGLFFLSEQADVHRQRHAQRLYLLRLCSTHFLYYPRASF